MIGTVVFVVIAIVMLIFSVSLCRSSKTGGDIGQIMALQASVIAGGCAFVSAALALLVYLNR